MKALLLAGGYAKRLWPLTKNKPKSLLEVKRKPIIRYILEKIEPISEINEIIISTNARFESAFKKFIKDYKNNKIKLVIEHTNSENEKLGSIGGLAFVLKKEKINEDLLIIGGDNIFEFDLSDFINYFKKKKKVVLALHDLKDKKKVKGKYGVCLLDKENIVIDFEEKPLEPKSALASTACYIFPKNKLYLVAEYLEEGNNPDSMGFLISWIKKKEKIYGYAFDEKWVDIGSFETLDELRR